MRTAEWLCTSCGVSNRRLVADGETRSTDRCVTCKTRHNLEKGDRPVFWRAVPSK